MKLLITLALLVAYAPTVVLAVLESRWYRGFAPRYFEWAFLRFRGDTFLPGFTVEELVRYFDDTETCRLHHDRDHRVLRIRRKSGEDSIGPWVLTRNSQYLLRVTWRAEADGLVLDVRFAQYPLLWPLSVVPMTAIYAVVVGHLWGFVLLGLVAFYFACVTVGRFIGANAAIAPIWRELETAFLDRQLRRRASAPRGSGATAA